MSIEGLIGLIIMLVVGSGALLLPFITTRAKSIGSRKRQLDLSRDELLASYERVLSTLRDLEDDFKSHKMNPADYEQERAHWSQYGIKLLSLLEGHTEVDDDLQADPNADLILDNSVEEAIKNYRVALQSAEESE
jgi:hypothetical protein